jgi:thiamine kinase-like enzyme
VINNNPKVRRNMAPENNFGDAVPPFAPGDVLLYNLHGCKIIRTAKDHLIKVGRRVQASEAHALEIIASRLPSLPIPRAHSVQLLPGADGAENGVVRIEMDFISGDILEDVWPNMSLEEKDSIVTQLRAILEHMRSLKSESGRIEACGGRPVLDIRRILPYTGGPFQNEAEFNDFLMADVFKATPAPLRTALANSLRTDHAVVFTHGDLNQHNIIVRDGRVVGLIDWECAGWFPEHWDYIKFFERYCKNKDWKDYAPKIFPKVYDEELVVYQALARWQKD